MARAGSHVMLLLAILLQAATPPAAPERFSILQPVPDERCRRKEPNDDIVVCGDPLPSQAVPYSGQVAPDHAIPSNPDMRASVALNGPDPGGECGVYGENCPVGFGGYAVPKLIEGAASAIGGAFKKKPDKRGRVPIPLEDPVPGHAQP